MASLLDGINFGNGNISGLLDFLKNNAWQQSVSPMLPSDVAQYGSPSPMNANAAAPMPIVPANQPNAIDSAPWPQGPVGAPPQNAMAQAPGPTPAAPPPTIMAGGGLGAPQPPGENLGFFDRLNAGLQSLGNGGSIIGSLTGNYTDPVSKANQALNMTARALVARGVDPAAAAAAAQNPELMKTLVTQTFGPKTVQSLGDGYVADKDGNVRRAYTPDRAPTPLGEGYIYKDGKVTRAYTPTEKPPQSVQEYQFYAENLPEGEKPMTYQRWLATKNTDPSKVNVLGRGGELYRVDSDGNPVIVHKNQDGGDAASIDDKTTDLLANRILKGDTKALTGLGRGAQGAANILKIQQRAAEIAEANGWDASDILTNIARQAEQVSGARALGTKSIHFGVAEKAMEESLPLALAASKAMPRTDWMTVNKLVQMGQREHSNPVLKRFLIATDTAAKDYARTINPQGALRESDIEYARKILSTADGPEAYEAALEQLKLEAQVMHRAIQRQRAETFRDKNSGDSHSAAPPTASLKPGEKTSIGGVKIERID